MRFLLKNGIVYDPENNINGEKLDIEVSFDKITNIFPSGGIKKQDLTKYSKVINLKNKYIFPGFIDIHAHFRDPGFLEKEDIESGSKAALHGGYTTVFVMPNTNPVIDKPELIEYIKLRSHWIDVFPVSAITKGLNGKEITNLIENFKAGAIAFSDDHNPVIDSEILYNALKESKKHGFIIIEHSMFNNIFQNGVINHSKISEQLKLKGLPDFGETTLIFRDLEILKLTGGKLHFTHVSVEKSVELILDAKSKGLDVSFDVTPHHLILDDSYLITKDPIFKVFPPLRSKENKELLVQLLKMDKIDIIATDHAPHTSKEKSLDIRLSPPGINGIETSFLLLYNEFILKNKIQLLHLLKLITLNPAKRFGLNKIGGLTKGKYADIVVFDPNTSVKITREFFFSKSKVSPFLNKTLSGKIEMVFKKGNLIYDNGEFRPLR